MCILKFVNVFGSLLLKMSMKSKIVPNAKANSSIRNGMGGE
jgi:hypothetical protein